MAPVFCEKWHSITGKMGTHRKWHPLTICIAVLICIVSSKSSNSVTFPSPVLVVQLCSSQRCPCRKQDQEASADCDGDFKVKFDTGTQCFAAQLMTHQLFGHRPVRASAPRTLTMATHQNTQKLNLLSLQSPKRSGRTCHGHVQTGFSKPRLHSGKNFLQRLHHRFH